MRLYIRVRIFRKKIKIVVFFLIEFRSNFLLPTNQYFFNFATHLLLNLKIEKVNLKTFKI